MSHPRPRLLSRWFCLFLAALGFFCGGLESRAQTPSDYALVRARLRASQTGGESLDATDGVLANKVVVLNTSAQNHWNALNKSPGRTALWNDLPLNTGKSDALTPIFDRLRTLSAAYATPGAGLRGNQALREDIVAALQWLNAGYFAAGRPFYDNWFPWHLGIPLVVIDVFACLHDGLPVATRDGLYAAYAAAIDYYQSTAGPTYAETGANRIWRARIDVGLGAALESPARLAAGRDKLSVVLPYVTSGDGFYVDGSFIQHNIHSYTGGYGLYLIAELSGVLETLDATPWRVVDPNLRNVFRWVDEVYLPVMFRGGIMDMTRGREISRAGYTDHSAGHATLGAIARVAQFADPATAARLRALVKGHIQSDLYRPFLANAGLSVAALVKPWLDQPGVAAEAPAPRCFVFGGMDRIVHRRTDWAYGVSLSSKRIAKYEAINGENLHGWFLGDGACYLYTGDVGQYADQYWPTVDPYRLAGITREVRLLANTGTASPNTIDPRSSKAWAGGVTVAGEFGVAGLDHEANQSDLRAKKAWFFFDEEVVHLGAAITSSDANPNRVETVVENRLVGGAGSAGTATLVVDGVTRIAAAGDEPVTSATWAHLAMPLQSGYTSGDIGYYFPGGMPLQLRREARTGRYTDINQSTLTSATSQTRGYISLAIDHGTRLTGEGASYAYVVLPTATREQVAAYARQPDIEVLANSAQVQAVRDLRLKALGVNFWAAGAIAGVTVNQPVALMTLERAGEIRVAVSDPTQENTGLVTVELPYAGDAVVASDPAVTVQQLTPRIRIQALLKGQAGRSLEARFRLASVVPAPPRVIEPPEGVTVVAGSTVALNVRASAETTLAYQWWRNGVKLAGATRSALLLPGLQPAEVGDYSCEVSNAAGAVMTAAAPVRIGTAAEGRLANLSVRGAAGEGARTLIVGFVVNGPAGSQSAPVLLRGAGPALALFGVPGVLRDPRITLYVDGTAVLANDDWGGDARVVAAANAVGAFTFEPSSKDAALYLPGLAPAAYTLSVGGGAGAAGVVLAEAYALPSAANARWSNLSVRASVGSGAELLIAGLVVEGPAPRTVLVRAVGPSLAAFGVTGTLVNPRLALFEGPRLRYENDDRSDDVALASLERRAGAFALPAGTRDAALVATLRPGAYTLQVAGVAETTGVALVEVYEVP